MKPICVVFADAFAYASYLSIKGIEIPNHVYRLTPGMGYSSNLHYQIFEGKGPDEVGFFSDFAYNGAVEKTSCGKFFKYLDRTRPLNDLVRFIYRKITKKSDNIPFCERKAFVHKGKYKFMQKGDCFVFGRKCAKAYERVVYTSFVRANEFLEKGEKNIVVVLEELDRQGHVVGYQGKAYVDVANLIVKETNKLFNRFLEKYPEGEYILISDHGMGYVNAGVNINDLIYRELGIPGKDYFFFCDSIYLRLWARKPEMLSKIMQIMERCDVLSYIDEAERVIYGASNTEFGDLIYRVREGYTFDPSCFGITGHAICTGMHGYMEHTDQSSGVIVTNIDIGAEKDVGAYEIYSKVMSTCEELQCLK